MHILKTNIHGNPNVGLYIYANDNICLLGFEVPDKIVKQIEEVLKVPCHKITIAGTSLIGVFIAGNNNCLFVPDIINESEIKKLDKLKINYKIIKTKHTALGNNILCNENGCMINSEFEDKAKNQVEEALNLKANKGKIAELDIVGSLAVFNDKGCLVHRDAEEEEIKLIETTLKLECDIGTINFGNPYIKSGIVANKNGFIVGTSSTGPEINNADHILKFIGE